MHSQEVELTPKTQNGSLGPVVDMCSLPPHSTEEGEYLIAFPPRGKGREMLVAPYL